MSTQVIIDVILLGMGATLFMDLWAILAKTVFGMAPSNFCLVGRWLLHMPAGRFRHANIAATESKAGECAAGWIFHYLIGIAYAALLLVFTGTGWLAQPTLLPALLLGIGTIVAPFFLMQPAFGLGIAASKAPNALQARLKSLMAHTVFGLGLYATGLLLVQAERVA